MTNTGMIRNLDELNRFVIPKEIIKTWKIEEKAPMRISTSGAHIILTPLYSTCFYCSSDANLVEYMGMCICDHCINELTKLAVSSQQSQLSSGQQPIKIAGQAHT